MESGIFEYFSFISYCFLEFEEAYYHHRWEIRVPTLDKICAEYSNELLENVKDKGRIYNLIVYCFVRVQCVCVCFFNFCFDFNNKRIDRLLWHIFI
jgi:hypothetical protein